MMHSRKKITVYILLISLIFCGCSNNSLNESSVTSENIKNEVQAKSKYIKLEGVNYNKWYYSQITSDKNRKIYEEIETALLKKQECIELKNADTEIVKKLFKMVLYDRPDIFYVNTYQYTVSSDSNIVVMPIYIMDNDKINDAFREIDTYCDMALSTISSDMTTFEKEKSIYDYIVSNTEYSLESEYNQSMYSVVLGNSVCLGYSKMFQYLCNMIDIPCTIVTGLNKEGIGHAWNAVYIENNWYMVDCTNGGGSACNNSEVNYYYFNVTRKQILRSFAINNLVQVPECDSIDSEFYYHNGLYFDSADIDRYTSIISGYTNKKMITVRASNEQVLNSLYRQLIEDRKIYTLIENCYQLEYSKDTETLILQIKWN